jgi:hypothetical protein
MPELGVNAAGVTFEYMEKAGFEDDFVKFYNEHIGTSCDGAGVGLKFEDEYGALTLCNGSSNGKLQEKEGPAIAEKLLKELQFEENVIKRVKYLIAHHHTYDAIDGIDYQILVEADFLVNILEDGLAKEAALQAYHNIFKTESGKNICQEMFAL